MRDSYILRRSTLWRILSTYIDTPAEHLAFRYGMKGKPFLPAHPQLHFNISHSHQSKGFFVCAVRLHFEIGIDVEQIRPMDDFQSIARHFFTPAEQVHLGALPTALQNRSFFECWTRKEAVIKATGEGVSHRLDSFEVAFGPDIEPKMLRFDQDDSPCWQIESFESISGYVGAIASRFPWHQLRIRKFPPATDCG